MAKDPADVVQIELTDKERAEKAQELARMEMDYSKAEQECKEARKAMSDELASRRKYIAQLSRAVVLGWMYEDAQLSIPGEAPE
jgi:hypothetical protein